MSLSELARHFDEAMKVSSSVWSVIKLSLLGTTNFFKLDLPSEFFSPGRRANDFQIVLAWREGFPETPRESRGVKGLGRVIGLFSPPPLNTLAGLNQFRTITLEFVPSTPLHGSAIAMDGCQEFLRESRGDRVMSHDSAPVLMQATGIVQFPLRPAGVVHGKLMDFGTYVRVRSIFFGVSVVFAYLSIHYSLRRVAGLLVPSSLLILGAPVGTADTPCVFLPPACHSSSYEGVGFAAGSARLGLRQSVPSSWCSSCSSWSSSSLLARFVVSLWVGSAFGSSETSFLGFFSGQLFCSYCRIYAVSHVPGFTRISGAKVTSHKSSTLSSHQMS